MDTGAVVNVAMAVQHGRTRSARIREEIAISCTELRCGRMKAVQRESGKRRVDDVDAGHLDLERRRNPRAARALHACALLCKPHEFYNFLRIINMKKNKKQRNE